MIDSRTVSLSLLAARVILPAQQGSTPTPTLPEARQLVAELNDDDGWERAAARLVLLRSEAARPLAESLQTAVKKGNDKVAQRILAVLGRLGLDASEATDSVWDALDDLSVDLATIGIETVLQITPPGSPARRQGFTRVLDKIAVGFGQNVEKAFRRVIAFDLRILQGKSKIDPDGTVDALHAGLLKSDFNNRDGYCQLLGQRGKEAKSVLRTLGPLPLNHIATSLKGTDGEPKDARFARNAAIAILHIDVTSKEAASAYGYLMLAEPFRDLRLRAARELLASPHIASATPFLVEILRRNSADSELTRAVINGLAMVGPKAALAIPILEKLAGGKDEEIAAKAKFALGRIRATGKKD